MTPHSTVPARYPVPARSVRTEMTIKRSRFITTIAPADSVEAARAVIQQIRAEMPDATHHVYAFRVGYGSSVQEGLSDDGEPAGTSGQPTMAVLRGADIGDVVLVTTRYFGGTKLGTGGLVKAYTEAAQQGVRHVPCTDKVTLVTCRARVPYHQYDRVKRLFDEHEAVVLEEAFAATIDLTFAVPEDTADALLALLCELTIDNVPPERLPA